MRFFILILAICTICLTGCMSNGGGEQTSSTPSTPSYTAPTNYAAATRAAVTPLMGPPVGPWDCEPVKVVGTPGTVLTEHYANGVTRDYTAQANGNFTNAATGYSLNMLVPGKTTLWFTVTSPTDAIVEWSGAQFTSVDSMGATWTSPENANCDHPQTVIRVTVTVAPSGNG
jgi:hypothetical protein